jgi:hypothetical protein
LHDEDSKIRELLENQKDITSIYSELSYDELKKILENWLSGNTTDDTETSATQETIVAKSEQSVADSFDFDSKPHQLDDVVEAPKATTSELPWDDEKPAVAKTTQQVADAFEDLFK